MSRCRRVTLSVASAHLDSTGTESTDSSCFLKTIMQATIIPRDACGLPVLRISRRFSLFFSRLTALLFISILSSAVDAQVSVSTAQNDVSRTAANLAETTLTTSNVNTAQFGKLFSRSVDAQVYAQP